MRTKLLNQLTNLIFGLFLLSVLAGCTPPELKDLKIAEAEFEKGNFRIALSSYEKVIKRSPESKYAVVAAAEAAKIAHYDVKDYRRAIEFNRFLVLKSNDAVERVNAQKNLAQILFENTQNYQEAIVEYNKLLSMGHTEIEGAKYKIAIARSLYYLGNFFQADSEISEALRFKIDDNTKFSALLLRGNIYVAQRQFTEAIKVLESLMLSQPMKSKEENVGISLAVCYEESGDYSKAIETLQPMLTYYKPKDYIELRIKRLQERRKNQPGAKGFRK